MHAAWRKVGRRWLVAVKAEVPGREIPVAPTGFRFAVSSYFEEARNQSGAPTL